MHHRASLPRRDLQLAGGLKWPMEEPGRTVTRVDASQAQTGHSGRQLAYHQVGRRPAAGDTAPAGLC